MQSHYYVLLFIILLALCWEFPVLSRMSYWREKPGKCPNDKVHCVTWKLHRCAEDRECKGTLKCCLFDCGFICLDPKQDICLLPVNKGKCKKSIQRFYYNHETNQCSAFAYYSCGGNANNFFTMVGCQQNCVKDNHNKTSNET
ncbi:WAP four-disulfide core domain protein 8-like [Antechinus flavipes]|uniref:WAP four-disulfide core domain protein 8-like n=1 Tax=Antechinus flavipes TaxID=38775 RepID=UPI002235C74C|nr:WAP four-disulfide core domain protein 8-like [Antechinus flavipes]